MSALACDICGGKLIMGSGSVALCDSCGMEHSRERMQEKVQQIRGTVRVDNSHLVDNYLSMAQNAYDANNKIESEAYCNKVIEIDPTNYRAWFIKGQAAGWQSTLAKLRFAEAVNAFIYAIEYAPSDEKEAVEEGCVEEIKSLSIALISLRADRFGKYPDKEEKDGFTADVTAILDTLIQFVSKSGVIVSEIMEPVAEGITTAVRAAWKSKILPDYYGEEKHPNQYEWRLFLDRCEYCEDLLKSAIGLSQDDDEADIARYRDLIHIHRTAIDSNAWDYTITEYGKRWFVDYHLTDNAKKARRSIISEYECKIREVEERKQVLVSKKREAFWNAHKEEYASFNAEKSRLTDLVKQAGDIGSSEEQRHVKERLDAICKTLTLVRSADGSLTAHDKGLIDSANAWESRRQQMRDDFIARKATRVAERDTLRMMLAEQEQIVAQNKQLFGQGAKNRKEAQEQAKDILAKLKNYADLK